MMSLDSAVDLVLYAFKHAQQGDMFVKKAPSCTIGDLALAIKELFNVTGRLQTVSYEMNLKYYNLIKEFDKLKEVPILLNTSFK